MEASGQFSMFHFLFCELIEQCYGIYKQNNYLENLKRIGKEIGYKIFNLISLKRGIYQRPQNMAVFMKNIQLKAFKHLFNYEAKGFFQAVKDDQNEKQYFYVLVDSISLYLSWMPESNWETAIFFAGMFEAFANCSGIKCLVSCQTKNQKGEKVETQYFFKLNEKQYQKWKEE